MNTESPTYNWWRCMQVAEQVFFCRAANPTRMLEIGPGDYTVTAVMRNLGVVVDTVDVAATPLATWHGDIRDPAVRKHIPDGYDLILASEVLEHMGFGYFDEILAYFAARLRPRGTVVIGLPFHTLRWNYRAARPFRRGGIVDSGIPRQIALDLMAVPRILWRVAWRRLPWKQAMALNSFISRPYDAYEYHHWDLGYRPTRVRAVKNIARRHFEIVVFHHDRAAGSGYLVLRKPD